MEAGFHNNQARAPPRRRRRGACEGCKQSKVRCDGSTPCEYCLRYSRPCRYHNITTRRHRRQQSSSSSSLYLSSTNSGSIAFEQRNETPSLQHTPASPTFNFDFSQYRWDEAEDELFKDLPPPPDGQWYELLDHSGPRSLDWDLTTLKAAKDADIQKDETNTKFRTSVPESNFGFSSAPAVASTAGEPTCPGHARDQECVVHDSGGLDTRLRNLVAHRGILETEELSIVDSALKQLCISKLPDCETTTRSEIPQQEVWKLLLDEDWRKAGIQAAFDVYTGLGDFLWETEINSLAGEVLTNSRTESLSLVLVLGVIAIGRHVLESQTTSNPVVDLGGSQHVFAESCTRIKPFLLGHNSLLKLQAIMSIRSDDTIAFDLISNAGACVQILCANQGSSSSKLDCRHEFKRQVDLNLATGAVYCLEHLFNMSNVNLVNNTRPFQTSSTISEDFRVRWMTGQVEYIKLCSYENEKDSQGRARDLVADLQKWKSNLPAQYHDVDQPYSRNIASDGRKLWIFCRYHEASLRFHMNQVRDAFDSLGDSEHGLLSARVVLEATSLLPPSVVLVNRKVYELVSLATRLIVTAVLRDPGPSAQANLRYLGMACGFFARLAMVNQVPFDAATVLLCVAQKVAKRPKLLETPEKLSVDEQPCL
ncbi:hypothetical protein NA56DRAFT_754660 [Hyaloscypha hepaticicola]|uniref:Zn(2)-C6 fungal-type domain-containing protein n=1 Tax=Hyaloscypha hepaticicola TaxID=2082293 RepID=A0A2J6PKX3_9HELO|nr:hypothetical protein NA56DRAFT_754660 [Hyaloscypha hepaticicola]